MELELEGNTALVTASSSGLGKASARALASEGANVVINGRKPDRLQKTVTELEAVTDGQIVGQPGDITDSDTITNIVDTAVDEFGSIDHIVTSAGGPPSGRFLDIQEDEWYKEFDLLVMSVVRLVHEAVEYLREGDGGTIVNITSMSAKEALDLLVLSNSVRMAVVGLEKTLSKELAPDIRTNTVLPNRVETDRVEDLIDGQVEDGIHDSFEAGYQQWVSDIPVGRLGRPEEFGDLIAFLCSDRSGFINGAAIPIDGGMSNSTM